MVFHYIIHLFKFVPTMKNIPLQKSFFSLILLLSISCLFSFKNHLQQFVMSCGTDFHGTGQIIENCTEDVTITSLPVDGHNGTIIAAEITSEGKIRIIPGVTSVKILPEITSSLDLTINENNTRRLRRSKIGGNGGNTRKIKTYKTLQLNYYWDDQQNLIIDKLNTKIIRYQVYNLYGAMVINKNRPKLKNNKLPLTHLKSAAYIIKIELQNGETITKKIIKQ